MTAPQFIADLLERPGRVLLVCASLSFSAVLFDGSLLRLWQLNREIQKAQGDSAKLQNQIKLVEAKITRAKDPQFLEKQARDRFDLVEKNDLVFVFSDEGE